MFYDDGTIERIFFENDFFCSVFALVFFLSVWCWGEDGIRFMFSEINFAEIYPNNYKHVPCSPERTSVSII
jgi:hypothetical protein